MSRTILHIDLDAFFCAVEELDNPTLRGARFAVGGAPESRGVVASCSYPARQLGIRSAMPMATARRICPDLIIVPARHHVYRPISRQVMSLLHEFTPLVEQISIDEAFLDVSALKESTQTLAKQIQRGVEERTGLPSSLGAAGNKLVAKIATDVGKAGAKGDDYPRSIQIVPPGEEQAFLAPLPVEALWGVGPRTAERLHQLGIKSIGDLSRTGEGVLARLFGKNGRDLHRRSRGIDGREVVLEREAKSISQENTFSRDVTEPTRLHQLIKDQAESVSQRLQSSGRAATTVRLKLRWSSFETITRQRSVDVPIQSGDEIARIASDLLAENWPDRRPVRLLGVGVSGLGSAIRQMSIFDVPPTKPDVDEKRRARLDEAVKELQRRFGDDAVQRGLP